MKHIWKAKHMKTTMAALLMAIGIQAAPVSSGATALTTSKVQVSIGSVTLTAGQSTIIPVTLTQPDQGVGSYNLQIDFNPEALEVLSVIPRYGSDSMADCAGAAQGCFQANYDNDEGWVRAIWVDSTGGDRLIMNAPQQLFAIQVKSKGDSFIGNQMLQLDTSNPESVTFTGADERQPMKVDVSIGQLQVVPEEVSENPPVPVVIPAPAQNPVTSTPQSPVEKIEPPLPGAEAAAVKVYIDGKEQARSASASTARINERNVTTISVDHNKVIEKITNDNMKTLMLPVNSTRSDVVIGELNGQLVKAMEGKEAVVEVQTSRASYTLPAAQIKIDQVSQAIGKEVALQDIKVSVKISEPSANLVRAAEAVAADSSVSLVVKPVEFEVEASYGDKKVTVDQFNHYVERSIALPEGVDPKKITTGVVIGKDGSLTHVPTKITTKDGNYYASINSLTNSTYSVVWNPKSFKDVDSHWSRDAVNSLASRLVIQGASQDEFAPERSITRAEFTAILLRGLGLHQPKGNTAVTFTDVASGSWYEEAIKTAVSYGLINGYEDGEFRPQGTITRAEAMTILDRALTLVQLGKVGSEAEAEAVLAGFSDQDNLGNWARQAAASAIRQGIVEGADGKLMPTDAITRAQTAAIISRLLVKANLINP